MPPLRSHLLTTPAHTRSSSTILVALRQPCTVTIPRPQQGSRWRRRQQGAHALGRRRRRQGHETATGVARTTFVTLTLRNPAAVDHPALELDGRLQALNKRLVGGEASIAWNKRDRQAAELAALLERRLDAWRSAP